MGFPDFMNAALYDPVLGYYARGTGQVGRGGDFFTSVSVGPLFGELLARRFLQEWLELGKPHDWRIIECGAHDGTLALDVLGMILKLDPRAFAALEYVIPEPMPVLRSTQKKTLQTFGKTVRHVPSPAELASNPLPGIAFGNEILDALPFHLVERQGKRWMECLVDLSPDGGFSWDHREIENPELLAALAPLGSGYPEGYRTEVRTCLRSFLAPLADALESGWMLWADYGFARNEYYHPGRTSGTLRTFSKHQAGEDPLSHPGEKDITAHVDFTSIAEAAAILGGRAVEFRSQGAWLTEMARDWLAGLEGAPDSSLLRQFQTLTHPAQLGSSFHFLELSWRHSAKPKNQALLANRLFVNHT